jgi:hypothetical protein
VQDPRFESPRGPDGRLQARPAQTDKRRLGPIVVAAAAGAAVLVAVLAMALPALRDWLAPDPDRDSGRLTILLLVVAALADLPLVLAGVHFWRLGERAIASRRFPPPGVALSGSERLLEGDEAVGRGRAAQTTALVLFGLGVAVVTALVGLVLILRSQAL